MDHRADERVALLGVARHQRLRSGDQHIAEAVVDVGMNDDALHADTALPRLVESAEKDAFNCIVEIGISIDNHCRIAAEFEYHLLLAATCLEIPANVGRSGEREQLEPVVDGE